MTASPPVQATEQKHLLALSSLRFLAAFHVVLFHVFPWGRWLASESVLQRAWAHFCSHGFSAVGFFFTLSGFILTYNYPARRLTSLRPFYVARFARVYPVYFIALIVSLPFFAVRVLKSHDYASGVLELGLALTLLQAWVPPLWFAVNMPGWSLSVEAFFYLLFPFASLRLRKLASTPARAGMCLVLLYAVALTAPLLGTYCSSTGMPLEDQSALANAVRYLPLLALPEFAIGIVLGHMFVERMFNERVISALVVPALLGLLFALCSDVVPYMTLHNGILLPAFGTVILACAYGRFLPALLTQPGLVRLGEASYSLYILHMPVFITLKIVIERSGFDPSALWAFFVIASGCVVASLISFHFAEEPLRRRILDAYKRATHAAP